MANFVGGYGPRNPSLIIVGEQPAYNEFRSGIPFVGEAGKALDRCLAYANVNRAACYVTNVVKWSVKLSQVVKYVKGTAKQAAHYEIVDQDLWHRCLNYLATELQQLPCPMIVACGGVALKALGDADGIGKWRGSVIRCTLDPTKSVIGTYHPATIIPPKNRHLNEQLIKMDLAKGFAVATGTWIDVNRVSHIDPSAKHALDFLAYIKDEGLKGAPVATDTEVLGDGLRKQLGCFSLGINHEVMCIPIVTAGAQRYAIETERQILLAYFDILTNIGIEKLIQNAIFEMTFLFRRYGIVIENLQCTMIGQHHVWPQYPKGLGFINSLYNLIAYYKDEGKEYFKGVGSDEQGFWMYNAMDSHSLLESWDKILANIRAIGNEAAYRRKLRILPVLAFAQEYGIKVLTSLMLGAREALAELKEQMEKDFLKQTGASISSPQQLGHLFYDKMGVTPPKVVGKRVGNRSTDKHALQQLAVATTTRDAVEEATIVQAYRPLQKTVTTYLKPTVVDPDGRFRAAAKPVGTVFARISTGKTIYGTGMNAQNWSHVLLSMMVPDDGHVYIGGDLSQAENRIVAYMAKCMKMINAFENGEDIHGLTGFELMKALIHKRASWDLLRKPAVEIDPAHTWRDFGKKSNHGLNYDLGPDNFAIHNNMTRAQGRLVHRLYHTTYPEIKGIYHPYIRACIRNTRTVVNLMGRKTFFTGGYVDETYKAGYSCTPQGTVGDMVDEGCALFDNPELDFFKDSKFLHQIHDHIGYQHPVGDWFNMARGILCLKALMERELETPWGTRFSIPFDIMIGTTLNKDDKKRAYEWKGDSLPSDPELLAFELEAKYKELLPPMNLEEFKEALWRDDWNLS